MKLRDLAGDDFPEAADILAGPAGDAPFIAGGHVHDDSRAVCLSRRPLAILVCIERIAMTDAMAGRKEGKC